MRLAMMTAALGLLLATQPASAQTLREELYDFGRDACSSAIDDTLEGVDGAGFIAVVDQHDWERAEYCHCVGGEFQDLDRDDLESFRSGTTEGKEHLAFIATMNLAICLPGQVDDDIADADWEEEELPDEDFAYDEGDVDMCQMALNDALMIPGFDLEGIREGMENTGQSREDLCTCSARYFAAGGEPLQSSIENAANPTIVYASTLAGAIETCRL